MNQVSLMGRLVRDPELRFTNSGQGVCQFTLAVEKNLTKSKKEEYKAQGKATADFIKVVVWGKLADVAGKFLEKGNRCLVNGSINTGSYKDKDGKTVYTTNILASNIEIIDFAKQYSESTQNENVNQADETFTDEDWNEVENHGSIPF